MNQYLAVAPGISELPDPALRLFCFHHAGAGALAFARWRPRFPRDVQVLPVRLPGRETRLREPRITDSAQLLAELDANLGPLLNVPHAFYGHSLGALVAYRFALHRTRAGHRPPVLVGVGACAAPHLPTPLVEQADLPDDRLLAALARYGTLPPYLFERPKWLGILLSTMRDDLQLARSLREGSGGALSTPLHAFAGSEDMVATVPTVAAWSRYTSAAFDLRTVAGGHFFVRGADLPTLLAAQLRLVATPRPIA
ncbi:thioesterase [Streptomyces lunaelactis]|uniref:thioesterase II family protein n=1 Tax=Streptomyces lunaelactis TaxID=1535768 RepID=UPI0015858E5B|nr:thioesterase [Streptomyces lunaelactis]NUK49162.1 thioesterase [Streptomyces lunaelactis]NUK62913.1 thioesterase [Streptomyces lunaelactis]NUK71181.1 thioesterase [Streptomyces lunaelactis]NUK81117.1 thioesterase [Streptomyces lunaelactis]